MPMPINYPSRRGFLAALPLAGLSATVLAGQPRDAARPVSYRPKNAKLRFAITSDGHFGQPSTPYEMFHEQMMDWLNEEVEGKGLDFVIINGDLIHDEPKLLPEVKKYYQRLKVPFYVTQGNHDRVSESVWSKTWGYPSNHTFEKDGYAFLLGSTSNEQGEYLPPDPEWLRSSLQRYKNSEGIFVFLHISQKKWVQNGIDSPETLRLLEQSDKVIAVFHGHDHQQDNVMILNGVHYFWDGHLGGSWGLPYRGYRIVEIDDSGEAHTYQCNREALVVNKTTL